MNKSDNFIAVEKQFIKMKTIGKISSLLKNNL